MRRLETSTNIWPIVHVGTYDGQPMDYNCLFDSEIEDLESYAEDGDSRIFLDDFDFYKWKEVVAEEAQKVFDKRKPLEKYGVIIKVAGMWSPREYNFMTDCLDLDVDVPDDFFEKAIVVIDAPENRDKVVKWINDCWKSRSGFASWMPQSLEDLRIEMRAVAAGERDPSPQLSGGVLSLLSLVEGEIPDYGDDGYDFFESFEYELQERVAGNHSASEFQTEVLLSDFEKEYGIRLVDTGKMIDEVERQSRLLPSRMSEFYPVEEEIRDQAYTQKFLVRRFLDDPSDARRKELEEFVATFLDRVQDSVNERYHKEKERRDAKEESTGTNQCPV